jgi:hypothetical protein
MVCACIRAISRKHLPLNLAQHYLVEMGHRRVVAIQLITSGSGDAYFHSRSISRYPTANGAGRPSARNRGPIAQPCATSLDCTTSLAVLPRSSSNSLNVAAHADASRAGVGCTSLSWKGTSSWLRGRS